MSEAGQSLPKSHVRVTSAFPLLATKSGTSLRVGDGQEENICGALGHVRKGCKRTSGAGKEKPRQVVGALTKASGKTEDTKRAHGIPDLANWLLTGTSCFK
jgi:hypothetical protein